MRCPVSAFPSPRTNPSRLPQVHPPLGKMLVGLAGALSGFNGSFDYPSGAVYPEHVPYRAMRVLLALPGIAMVPLAWGTAVELRFSKWSQHIVTLMVLCGASGGRLVLTSDRRADFRYH